MYSFSFAADTNTGLFCLPPRSPGEIRKFHQEYWDAQISRWSSATFVEDDDGMRWINDETSDVYPVSERPYLLTAYADHPPWAAFERP